MTATLTTPASAVATDTALPPCDRRRLSVLLLCDDQSGHANTVLDHIATLTNCAEHDVRVFNPCGMKHSRYLDLNEFDVIVIHYSLVIISDYYLSPAFREQIRRFHGLKVQFIQDEYRWVDEIAAMMRHIGIHVLFTLLPPSEIPKVYSESRLPGVIKIPTLAGYVPDSLVGRPTPPLETRPVDIGYRGRTLPYWLGRLAQEKVWIGQGVLARADRYGLRCDIKWAEGDRIYGQRWNEFLMACKATLGTESGASITDFNGSLERRTKAYLAEHPSADFNEVHRQVLAAYEDNARVTAISPRIFEAAALRTALILFPGEYSGLVQPWVHYIPLAKDYSNMDEVVKRLRDIPFLRELTERAYQDLVASGRCSQGTLARDFSDVITRYGARISTSRKVCYRLARLEQPCAVALQRIRVAADPILRLPLTLIKGGLTSLLLLASAGGRAMLAAYLADHALRKRVSFSSLLKDSLKLAVVGQARRGGHTIRGQFQVAVHVDRDEGRLVFESLAAEPDVETSAKHGWADIAVLVREGSLRTMVWNHAALGGNARYQIASGISLTVGVGEYDLYAFDSFVELARRAPEAAVEVLRPLLQEHRDPS